MYVCLYTLIVTVWLAGHSCSAGKDPVADVLMHLAQRSAAHDKDLLELVAIPSVSSLPEHNDDVVRAGHWVVDRMKKAGLDNTRLIPTSGPFPVAYGDSLHAAGAPTFLIYGHYDVQPVDPLELWTSPPFDPEIRDGNFYGRGADDDKGGFLPAIHAVEAILQVLGSLPVNVKFLIEGEEEVGSPHLAAFLEAHTALLAADYAISADGGQINETQPGITLGLRGAAAMEVEVTALGRDVHSGLYGGAVQNPIRALSQVLASMFNPDGSVAVERFYDGVRAITPVDKADIKALGYDERRELGLVNAEPYGEAGFSTLERIWLRPTLEICGIAGGFAGTGIKTIIPSKAIAKIACRLVPDQDPAQVLRAVRSHIEFHLPPAVNVSFHELGFSAKPYVMDRRSPVVQIASKVLEDEFGRPVVFVKRGATIPALQLFQEHLDSLSTLVFAFGLPDDAAHAPNERLGGSIPAVSMFRTVLGIETTGFAIALGENIHAPNERMRVSMYRKASRAFAKLLLNLASISDSKDKTEL